MDCSCWSLRVWLLDRGCRIDVVRCRLGLRRLGRVRMIVKLWVSAPAMIVLWLKDWWADSQRSSLVPVYNPAYEAKTKFIKQFGLNNAGIGLKLK